MRSKRADSVHWERVFGKAGPFAQMPPFQMQKVISHTHTHTHTHTSSDSHSLSPSV